MPRSDAEAPERKRELTAKFLDQDGERNRPLRARPGHQPLPRRLAAKARSDAYDSLIDGFIERAVELARKAVSLDGMDPQNRVALARSLFSKGEYEEAAARYREIKEQNGLLPGQELAFLMCEFKLKKVSFEDVERYYSQNRDDEVVHEGFLLFLYELGDKAMARKIVEERIRLHRSPADLVFLAVLDWEDGNDPKAVALLEESTRLDPGQATTWADLGVGLAGMRRFGLAIEAFRKAIQIRPHYQFARLALAEIYALMGDADAAVQPLEELLANGSVEVKRVLTERAFDPVRNSEVFRSFLKRVPGGAS
ncbi:MAG TPA: tetratricopeptide repeat protein [Fimbriimonadaceae bacterium]